MPLGAASPAWHGVGVCLRGFWIRMEQVKKEVMLFRRRFVLSETLFFPLKYMSIKKEKWAAVAIKVMTE